MMTLQPRRFAIMTFIGATLVLAGCASNEKLPPAPRTIGGQTAGAGPDTSGPKPHRKVGNPYKVAGIWYYPKEDPTYDTVGVGSWYGPKFHGRKTANGEIFDMNRLTAAHPTLPLPSTIKVTNLGNGKSIFLRLNDRGPFAHDRIVDLSRAAAERLGYREDGLAQVRVEYIGEASLADAITTIGAPAAYADGSYADVFERPAPAEMTLNTVKTRIATGPEITGPVSGSPGRLDTGRLDNATLETARVAATEAEARIIEMPLTPDWPVSVTTASATPVVTGTENTRPATRPSSAEGSSPLLLMVQVGAYSSIANAEKAVDRFSLETPVRTAQIMRPDGTAIYRVRLGPYNSAPDADAALTLARSSGFTDARIVAP